MMVRRKMLKDLEEWKEREHKRLLIDGPRGVGKTTLVRKFARSEGSEILEVDISRNAEARRLFQSHHEPDDIVSGLEDITGQEVNSGRERDTMHIDEISRVFDDGNIRYDEDRNIEHYPYFCAAFMDSMMNGCEPDLWHPSI